MCGLLIVSSVVAARASRSIKSNAVTRLKRSLEVTRHRRQTQTLTTDQKKEIVDRHNAFRRMENASNMELLVG